jgi:hypothetical protein
VSADYLSAFNLDRKMLYRIIYVGEGDGCGGGGNDDDDDDNNNNNKYCQLPQFVYYLP